MFSTSCRLSYKADVVAELTNGLLWLLRCQDDRPQQADPMPGGVTADQPEQQTAGSTKALDQNG